MSASFHGKRIFLVGGPGGVGKTTLAASLGIRLARRGHRTVVLTVDPAKRLAQALGLDSFHSDLQKVDLPLGGKLWASMLDTQRYFDKVISRFANSPEQKEKILSHPIYRAMVDTLGGTHEYAAMERLLEFAEDHRFEKIVIDTPPSQNAVELFAAPQRLADFMDQSVLKWFQGPVPRYLKFFRTSTKMAMKLLQRLLGGEFLSSFSTLLDSIEGMQAGFQKRNLEVIRLLQSPQTAFLLVTAPTETRYVESRAFLSVLEQKGIALSGVILNRLEPHCPNSVPQNSETVNGARAAINELLGYYHGLYQLQQTWVKRFQETLPQHPIFLVPRQEGTLHEVNALSHLGSFLLSLKEDAKEMAPETSKNL